MYLLINSTKQNSNPSDNYNDSVKHKNNKIDSSSTQNDMSMNQQNMNNDANIEGIKLDYFASNWSFLHGVHPEIKIRLFKALGIDTESRNSIIKWEQFVELYCIWDLGQLDKNELILFWTKFLDPTMLGCVAVDQTFDTLEKLVRGISLNEPNEGTELFAKTVINIFEEHGWIETINNEKFVNVRSAADGFKDNTINMQMFSDALGNKVVNMTMI
jgi:hypothetical protein